jgi:hypothetical protein
MADEITKNDDEETIETTEQPKKKILKGNLPVPPREKKERTPAQIAAFERARASRESNLKKREADAKRLAEYDAMLVKQKLVEKAQKIKLKTMKKIETIDAISSDEDEVIIERKPTGGKPPTPHAGRSPPQPTPQPAPKPKIVPYKFV